MREGPKFRALATAIREAVHSGDLPPGTRLPAMRDLAWSLGMTPGTVARAYQIAAAEGAIDSHVGRGSFVTQPDAAPGLIQPLIDSAGSGHEGPADLRSPQLPDLGQTAAIATAMHEAAEQTGADLLNYPPLAGDLACRQALLDWLGQEATGNAGPDDMVLTHGGQSAILLILSICLVGERPRVMAEGLSYPGLRHAARLLRADIAPVAQDTQGMLPEHMDRVARHSGARLVFLTPSAQNPTAGMMTTERREALIRVARHHDLQIIEDESYSNRPGSLRAPDAEPALRMLAPERVWQIAGLSKILSAGLRFGALICPSHRAAIARLAAQHSYFGLSRPLTLTVTRLLNDPQSQRLAGAVMTEFVSRAAIARRILPADRLTTQPALPFVWLTLPAGWRASRFAQAAAAQGVLVRPADEFAAVSGTAQPAANAVRIALAGNLSHQALADALWTLRRLYDTPQGEDMVV